MPIYEYRCDRCDQTFEVIQKFSDTPLTTHEGCGGAVEKLVSSSALQFKGTGWYVTDYAKKNGSSGSGKSESKGDSSKSESSKSDSGKGDSGKGDSGKGESSKGESQSTPSKTETSSSKSDSK